MKRSSGLRPRYIWQGTLVCQAYKSAKLKPLSKFTFKRFEMHRTVTLGAEVTNVSTHCFWLLVGDEELAVPFTEFPWFKKATFEQLSDVQRPTEDHLYWPQLDVDLSVESIRRPESFPLVSRSAA